ncbi:MAG: GPI inositol-deacylase [Actinomycetota bacterium]|uniref:GPI inositol-deacylase n=1 Tax=Mycobacterium lentiflavum TaxID=141349 RepID=A0ABY3UQH7_MYCLN|nr:GPI inositol-deacylase [Mycobacterium lentiflavum]MEE3064946.1 GPI inositol-deacylase [Actinomycetota bacterium]ULP41861.1 GPI inositol-deacylase [Mycobacterium lentiflavum]
MARVVGVHGIGHQWDASETLTKVWAPAMVGGVEEAGGLLSEADVTVAFYGIVFRPPGRKLGDDAPIDPEELDDFEKDLLIQWWYAAAARDPYVDSPDARTLGAPGLVRAALLALSNSRFFAGVTSKAMSGNLRQVRDYLHNDKIRQDVRQRVVDAIGSDTTVLVGHSLGSVVAYEVLCNNPNLPVTTLVTLGSPLGIPNLIFDKLDPAPTPKPKPKPKPKGSTDPRGQWPAGVTTWTNISDSEDVVALQPDLRPLFGSRVTNWVIDNGDEEHGIKRYLTARETGAAIAAGL